MLERRSFGYDISSPAGIVKPMELHLVADTNLFFEFKPLEHLLWSELAADPIIIVLTKPVVDEIDKHKKSTGRTRDRAIDIFNRLRAMLTSGATEAVIQDSGPRVMLRRMTSVRPDPKLEDHLDYGKPDEKLVGIVATLAGQAAGYDVKLFTDDAGAAGTAADFGVPFQLIDPGWRRPPAESTEAKQLKEAKKDLAMYRSLEPRIVIRCETADADGVVTVVDKVAKPLAELEVDALSEALRAKHPARADFSPPPTSTSTDVWGETKTIEYSPQSDDEVANYRDVRYPAWIETCRQSLRGLHVGRDEAAPLVLLRWAMSNDGSRPAKDAAVVFTYVANKARFTSGFLDSGLGVAFTAGYVCLQILVVLACISLICSKTLGTRIAKAIILVVIGIMSGWALAGLHHVVHAPHGQANVWHTYLILYFLPMMSLVAASGVCAELLVVICDHLYEKVAARRLPATSDLPPVGA
ncbi:PIN domain-containing protein [Bradyrhizobium sp. 164]|uniref:PIN domain-containing protein n=1 Tax=Bradyrhizobium sp. 164 TaxID=2782637 RepID=UPI001FF9E1FD|nr:PIN domain-containing protein [Bradyrhizobium sp. 164]MCK1597960.1 hypothetical protein [Bradyrhizobium sp. 164]